MRALTIGVLITLVEPSLADTSLLSSVIDRTSESLLSTVVGAVFAVVILAVVSAYLAQSVYRLLEGYHLPLPIYRRLRRRQMRVWWVVQHQRSAGRDSAAWGIDAERRWEYPERMQDVMPTRLGNALRAAETYGRQRWNLDSLTVWHELLAVTPPTLVTEVDDSRAAMDFFAGSVVQFGLLGTICLAVAPSAEDPVPIGIALAAYFLVWPAYIALIRRVGEYRSALQAVVNLGRKPLSEGLGYALPDTAERELFLWANLTRYLRDGDRFRIDRVDRFRTAETPSPTTEESS